MIDNETPVWHNTLGFGTVRKTHKNGRISVAFADYVLPKTVDEDELHIWTPGYTGSDYE